VVSTGGIETAHGLLRVAMITSAENRGWPEDVPIADLGQAGLPAPSIIRPAKITTFPARDAETIGPFRQRWLLPSWAGSRADSGADRSCLNPALD